MIEFTNSTANRNLQIVCLKTELSQNATALFVNWNVPNTRIHLERDKAVELMKISTLKQKLLNTAPQGVSLREAGKIQFIRGGHFQPENI